MLVDLTKPLYDHMPVYPGDPDLLLTKIQTLEHEGWNMHRIEMNLHDGTHVNAPIHMAAGGKTLDELPPERFCGPCVLYQKGIKFLPSTGVIFALCNIDTYIANQLIKTPPKFIGLSEKFEFDIALEKLLLEHDIISFENLTNTDELPPSFTFYGFPLKIKSGDGSPVRAVAMLP